MPSIGPLEIIIVVVIALLVFGPEKLPDIARTIGKAAGEMRRMAADVRDEFEVGLDDADEPAAPTAGEPQVPAAPPAEGPEVPAAPPTEDRPEP